MDIDHLRHRLGLAPSGEGASLALLRQRLQRAEADLEAARVAMRSAADAAGIERAGLFSGSAFIPRSTGDSWFEAGKREGEKAMADILTRSVDMDATDKTSRFRHLARRLQKISPQDWPEHVAKMRAVVAGDHAPELSSQNKGEAILAAGRRARMSGSDERPQPEGLAAKIIAAGKRARTPTGGHEND